MIQEIDINNISNLDDSFFKGKFLKEELRKNPFAKVLVFIRNNCIIAYLYYSDIYERVEINQIEVDISYRNCGIGSILMKHLIQSVNKDITLEVRVDNVSALKLYKNFGFQIVAIRKKYYHGIDGCLLERNHNNS